MFNLNKLIKNARLQKLANQSMLNNALSIEMVKNFFSESKKNFSHLILSEKRTNRKKWRYG